MRIFKSTLLLVNSMLQSEIDALDELRFRMKDGTIARLDEEDIVGDLLYDGETVMAAMR